MVDPSRYDAQRAGKGARLRADPRQANSRGVIGQRIRRQSLNPSHLIEVFKAKRDSFCRPDKAAQGHSMFHVLSGESRRPRFAGDLALFRVQT